MGISRELREAEENILKIMRFLWRITPQQTTNDEEEEKNIFCVDNEEWQHTHGSIITAKVHGIQNVSNFQNVVIENLCLSAAYTTEQRTLSNG